MENKSSKPKKTKKRGSLIRFLERAPLYPFLIAIYPVVYLLSENITEIGPEAGLRPAILFLLIAALFFSISLLLTRSPSKSGLITLIAMLAYFLVFLLIYAPAYRLLREVTIFGRILGRHRYLAAFFFLISPGGHIICFPSFSQDITRIVKNDHIGGKRFIDSIAAHSNTDYCIKLGCNK